MVSLPSNYWKTALSGSSASPASLTSASASSSPSPPSKAPNSFSSFAPSMTAGLSAISSLALHSPPSPTLFSAPSPSKSTDLSSKQKEDFEFSVGSKQAVWEVKTRSSHSRQGQYQTTPRMTRATTMARGAPVSLVGGLSGQQFYNQGQ